MPALVDTARSGVLGELGPSVTEDGAAAPGPARRQRPAVATREPWLVIDPKPLSGERAFAVAPIVRSTELGHSPRRRCAAGWTGLTAELGLDRDRARGWTIGQTMAWATGGDAAGRGAPRAGRRAGCWSADARSAAGRSPARGRCERRPASPRSRSRSWRRGGRARRRRRARGRGAGRRAPRTAPAARAGRASCRGRSACRSRTPRGRSAPVPCRTCRGRGSGRRRGWPTGRA